MLINLRNALMAGKRLPYDAEVEFLESTGTQWIDTGVIGVSEWHVTAQGTATPSASNCVIATKSSGGSFWGAFRGFNYWAVGSAGDSTNYRITLPYTSLGAFVVNFNSNSVTFTDGVETATRNSTPNFSESFYLFSTHNYGYAAKVKIFGCKVYQNSILVRDFIPVRKGTVGYLYDRVSKRLFGNAGTGDFVLGPDVVPVEYIESHGTEWIDTGVVATDAYGVRIDIATAQKSGTINTRIFGIQQNDVRFGFALYGTGQAGGNTAFWGWNAATPISAAIPQRFVASLNYQNDRKAIFNGTAYISSLGTLGSLTLPFYLLNANYGGAPFSGQYVIGKLYGAEVSVGSDITNRYKPIRVGTGATSWEGAMMDVLTRRIYRNAGTGAFAYGNDLKYPIPAE